MAVLGVLYLCQPLNVGRMRETNFRTLILSVFQENSQIIPASELRRKDEHGNDMVIMMRAGLGLHREAGGTGLGA